MCTRLLCELATQDAEGTPFCQPGSVSGAEARNQLAEYCVCDNLMSCAQLALAVMVADCGSGMGVTKRPNQSPWQSKHLINANRAVSSRVLAGWAIQPSAIIFSS